MKAPDFLAQLGVDDDEFTTDYDGYTVQIELGDETVDVDKIEFDHTYKKIIIRTD